MIATILFAIAAAILFYILLGYPLLLALGRWREWAIAKDLAHTPTVSVVVAVYNGQEFIGPKLKSLTSLDYPDGKVDVVIVSDGSTDDTERIVEEFDNPNVRLIRVARGGKAAAVNAGVEAARGELIFFTDVRQLIEKDSLRHLAANFADPKVGAATGELRYMSPAGGEQAVMDMYWRYEVWARKKHSKMDSLMGATGAIYVIRRNLVDPLPADTLSDDVVLPLRAFLRGHRVILDGNAIALDYPTKSGTEFPRKIRTLAGLWQAHLRQPAVFSSANRMRWHFLSHKFGRLAMPWVLIVMTVAAFAMPDSLLRTIVLWGELLLLAVAAADQIVPAKFPLKRLFSAARAFLLMNLASLLAIRVFWVSPQQLWKRTQVGA